MCSPNNPTTTMGNGRLKLFPQGEMAFEDGIRHPMLGLPVCLSFSIRVKTFHNVLVYSGCHGKIPQPEGLKQQTFISHSAGGWKSKIRVSMGLVPGWETATFPLCPHMACFLCTCRETEMSGPSKDTRPIRLDHTLVNSFNLNHFHKGAIS